MHFPQKNLEDKNVFRTFAYDNQQTLKIKAMVTRNKSEKLSLLDRAKRMGKVLELVPGFSFDSDSQVKLYAM